MYGTIYIEGRWLPGALETLRWLFENDYKVRFITNTTLRNRKMLNEFFAHHGFEIEPNNFFIPACAANTWFKTSAAGKSILALVHSSQVDELEGLVSVENENADYVLVGDMGDEWRIEMMNLALKALRNGATLTALQKNTYWLAADGPRLDCGAFVAALEAASGKSCDIVFGKPSELFFMMAIDDVGEKPESIMMVGDDIESDIIGAAKCGLPGALVKTGKSESIHRANLDDFEIIESIGDLPRLLQTY